MENVIRYAIPWGSKRGNIRISIIKVNVHDGVHEVSLQYGLYTFTRSQRFKLIVTIFINTVWDGINFPKSADEEPSSSGRPKNQIRHSPDDKC